MWNCLEQAADGPGELDHPDASRLAALTRRSHLNCNGLHLHTVVLFFVFLTHSRCATRLLPAVMEITSRVEIHREARGPFSLRTELLLGANLRIYLLNGPRGIKDILI